MTFISTHWFDLSLSEEFSNCTWGYKWHWFSFRIRFHIQLTIRVTQGICPYFLSITFLYDQLIEDKIEKYIRDGGRMKKQYQWVNNFSLFWGKETWRFSSKWLLSFQRDKRDLLLFFWYGGRNDNARLYILFIKPIASGTQLVTMFHMGAW